MGKATKEQLTATQIAAEQTVTPEARKHGIYIRQAFTERDVEGGHIDGSRMVKLTCAKGLQGLAVRHPKAMRPFLMPFHLMAANAYQCDVHEAQGGMNHELREAVDKPTATDASTVYRLEAANKIASIGLRMNPALKAVVDRVIVSGHDESLQKLWPSRAEREQRKDELRDGLHWLAVEYRLVAGYT